MARKKPASAMKPPASAPPTTRGVVPAGYALALEQLKTRIRSAQLKAAVSINRELIELYWPELAQVGEEGLGQVWTS